MPSSKIDRRGSKIDFLAAILDFHIFFIFLIILSRDMYNISNLTKFGSRNPFLNSNFRYDGPNPIWPTKSEKLRNFGDFYFSPGAVHRYRIHYQFTDFFN